MSVKRSQWPGDISFPDSRFERDENFNVVRRCVLMNCALYRKLKFGSTSSRGNRRNRYGNYRKLYSSRRKDMRSRDEIAGVDKRAFEKFLVEVSVMHAQGVRFWVKGKKTNRLIFYTNERERDGTLTSTLQIIESVWVHKDGFAQPRAKLC